LPRIGIADLRRYAVGRSLFPSTTLRKAIERLGFVQADPIRAPARAQDLILRQRVRAYRVSDLERRYPSLPLEEDYFVNYGFLPRRHHRLLHPRKARLRKGSLAHRRMADLLEYAVRRGEVHPREAAEHFAHGRVQNYWGGGSNATTQLLDLMHFQGLLRVARRDNGIRVYAPHQIESPALDAAACHAQAQALLQLVVNLYAPLPAASLTQLTAMLRRSAPHLGRALDLAAGRARATLAQATVDGTLWYWPAEEQPCDAMDTAAPSVRLLAPFDPVVWDRRRFERFWSWAYRFEAYTPAARRKLGYYALPLLWRDRVIGWGNLSIVQGELVADLGYVAGSAPKERIYRRELEAELARLAHFLRLRRYRASP
jgi:uncharacterized protein YcaQ